MKTHIKFILSSSILLQYVIVSWLSKFPASIETYYSNYIYIGISAVLNRISGLIPFSLGDLFYISILSLIIYWISKGIKKKQYWSNLANISLTISILYFLFYALWGLNYFREPISKQLNIKTTYTETELIETTKHYIIATNQLHFELTKNDTLKFNTSLSINDLKSISLESYRTLKINNIHLHPYIKKSKNSWFSYILNYTGFSGYLNPFTNEAQINKYVPKHKLPLIICHEHAHQLGFSAENEANYIGIIACRNSENTFVNYSGSKTALRYLLNEVYKYNEDEYLKLRSLINIGVLKDFKESRAFWEKYENPYEVFIKKGYDSYLKANNQSSGIKSYNLVVGLLINDTSN